MTRKEFLIVTHNGKFHLDDVIACHILKTIYPRATIIRTRDPRVIEKATIVVDVGRVYDPEKMRYDHHQSSFCKTYSEKYSIKLSSSGLVFIHHIRDYLDALNVKTPDNHDFLIEKLYASYFCYVDASDNGYECGKDLLYISRELCDVIETMNPTKAMTPEKSFAAFKKAMEFVGGDLKRFINWIVEVLYPSRDTVALAYARGSGEILIIEDSACYFQEFIHDYNKQFRRNVQFVVRKEWNGHYRISGVPEPRKRFGVVQKLKKEWRGKSAEEIQKMTGIMGCLFVHNSGFCGLNETLEGAIQMAKASLNVT